jgi:VPDSG-CTERM motif
MKNRLLLLCSLATALSAMTTRATVTNITPGDGLLDKSEYFLLSGDNNNSLAGNLNLLNSLISPDEPSVGASYDGLNLTSFTLLPGWHYAVLHFGTGQAGGQGGYWQVYESRDLLGGTNYTLPYFRGKPVGALSSVRYVPDGGSTVMLLGAALSVIAVARRKFGV